MIYLGQDVIETRESESEMEKKTTHTPGPWKYDVFETPSGQFDVYSLKETHRRVAYHIANEEDARLIAAAPELLAASAALLEALDAEPRVKEGPLLKALRAAIAKAEGR